MGAGVNVQALLSGTSGPQQTTLTAPDPTQGFGSVTIYNATSSIINVYFARNGAFGTPDIQVQPSSVLTQPCPGVPYITFQLATYPCIGSAQITCVDTVLSSASSIIPGNVGAPGIPPGANSGSSTIQWATVQQYASSPGSIYNGSIVATEPAGDTTQLIYVYSYDINGYVASTAAGSQAVNIYLLTDLSQYLCAFSVVTPTTANQYTNFAFSRSGGDLPLMFSNPLTPGAPANLSFQWYPGGANIIGWLNVNVSYALI